jgi:hypothetical protein
MKMETLTFKIGQNEVRKVGQVIDFMNRRGGRAVECTGLENRRPFTGLVSSNLTLSAKQ